MFFLLVTLPNRLHCVVFPDLSHPSSTINAPRSGTFLHIFNCLEGKKDIVRNVLL